MAASPLLAGVPVAFVDGDHGISALALQHVHHDAQVALVYHDAPGQAATMTLIASVATALRAQRAPGQQLAIVESSMPEHPAETFVYAHAALRCSDLDNTVQVVALRVTSSERVARLCGITGEELRRTEQLVTAIHRPPRCAFPGFAEVRLGGGGLRQRGLTAPAA